MAIYGFWEMAMEKGVLHIQLMNWQRLGRGKTQDGSDCGWFDDGAKGLGIIYAGC